MTPNQIADLALELGARGFEERVAELVSAADGDPSAVATATHRILASRTRQAIGAEHIAFTYLAAAFRQITSRP